MTEENTQSLYIVDCSNLIFRAYHALPPLTSPDGVPTGAVFGFCNMLFKLLDQHRPGAVAAVFDTAEPTFRKQIYPEYKANRPPPPEDLVPQFELVDRAVEGFRIPALRLPGYEADDIIGALTVRAREAGMAVTVVSADKDLMQLVGDGVRLLDTMREREVGPEEVRAKFGVGPEKLGDLLALTGDSVDNVPGVPGVGPKTAAKLLCQFGDLEGVLAGADEIKGAKLKEKIRSSRDRVRLSRRLVALALDAPLEVDPADLAVRPPDAESLSKLFEELGFSRLVERVGGTPSAASGAVDRSAYRLVLTEADLDACLASCRAADLVAVDVETTSLFPVSAALVGVCLAWAPGEACYVPVGHDYLGAPAQLDRELVLERLRPLLEDPDVPKVGQNFKYDWIVLRQAGVTMRGVVFDPMLASYLLDASRQSHGLDALSRDLLGHTMLGFKEVAGKEGAFSQVELWRATEYAAEDADVTLRLARRLSPRIEAAPRLAELLREVELPLAGLLARMELHGVVLDVDQLRAMSGKVGREMRDIEQDVQRQAGWDVNINSPKQLQKLLFEDLGLTPGRKTKSGYSTDADTLADLAVEHPIAGQIEQFRTLAKLQGTYIDALPRLVNPKTGRVHTSYNQAVAATGRLSSSDPNLQNIPIRTELGREIRRAFVAPEGRVLLAADYSQVELRILAHLSDDPGLLDAFGGGADVHTRTAAEVFGVPPGEVTPEQRRVAKAVNFGVVYGQTDWGLSRQLRIPRATAAQYIESYFRRYAGVQAYMERVIEQARETGEVRTLMGRRRPVPDVRSTRRNVRLYAERVVRNTPIQGTAADLIKVAMLRVDRALADAGLDAPMILTVHDEVVLEVRREDVARVSELVEEAMSGVLALKVPLVVDLGVGESWAEAHG